MTSVGRLAIVARWKPVHLGHEAVLDALVAHAGSVVIGIGSSNRYDQDNPFTAAESAAMIRAVLGERGEVELVEVPDLGHGPRWRAMVAEMFGPLDGFVTANDYVAGLMREVYPVIHPLSLIALDRRVPLSGTMVRKAMARGEGWRGMVPSAVAEILDREGLVARFRREFGLATLALDAPEPVD